MQLQEWIGCPAESLTKSCFADNRVIPDCAASNFKPNCVGKLDSVHVVSLNNTVYDAEIPVSCRFLADPYTCIHTQEHKLHFNKFKRSRVSKVF